MENNNSFLEKAGKAYLSYMAWAAAGVGIVFAAGALNYAFNKESAPVVPEKTPVNDRSLENAPR